MNSFKKTSKRAIIISISSDIGNALAKRWLSRGYEVAGTYRTLSRSVEALKKSGAQMVSCDLSDARAVHQACGRLRKIFKQWDYLVLCPGDLEPVGPFEKNDFSQWAQSVEINFVRQMQLVHALLSLRRKNSKPVVLFFAGGGTNSAPVNYSAYTISKIALIKMCELLDAEIPDTHFAILGPGFVKTKIHQATLKATHLAGTNYQKTRSKLSSNEGTPMEDVLDCCDWIIHAPRAAVSGRNFSVAFDAWGSKALTAKLLKDKHLYKLRRHGNE